MYCTSPKGVLVSLSQIVEQAIAWRFTSRRYFPCIHRWRSRDAISSQVKVTATHRVYYRLLSSLSSSSSPFWEFFRPPFIMNSAHQIFAVALVLVVMISEGNFIFCRLKFNHRCGHTGTRPSLVYLLRVHRRDWVTDICDLQLIRVPSNPPTYSDLCQRSSSFVWKWSHQVVVPWVFQRRLPDWDFSEDLVVYQQNMSGSEPF